MASVYATIANGGVRVDPLDRGRHHDPAAGSCPRRAAAVHRVIQAKTAHELMGILQQVPWVDAAGGEPWGMIPGYSVAAKTGTAQIADPGRAAACACTGPASSASPRPGARKLVVAVNVQNPRKGGYFGIQVAGPVFYKVMKFALHDDEDPARSGPSVPTSGSRHRDQRYPRPVPAALLPRDVPPRPLSELAMLLGLSAGRAGPDPLAGPGGPVTVSGVTHDSRRVRPGDLYAALPGSQHHGAHFCDDAAGAGAVAVLTDPDGKSLARHCGLPVFVVSDPRARLGEVASWIYGNPSGRLTLIGVTGTSGKTSTTYLLESGLRMAGHVTGLLGRRGDPGGRRRRAEPAHHARGHRPAGAAGRDGASAA